MTVDEIKAQFNKVLSVSQYVRVSETHPLELYLGLNEVGQKTLRFNGQFVPSKLYSTKSLDIKQLKFDDHLSILFSSKVTDNDSLFYKFCEDIINYTKESTQEIGYKDIINRYIIWKKFFTTKATILSEKEIMGLIGELMYLKEQCFFIHGVSKGLAGWSGSEPTNKDFSYEDTWFEIKTIGSSSKTITISSLEQLDSTNVGYLVVYRLEKMSSNFDGISLNKLVEKIINEITFENDKELFVEKLSKAGYSYNEFYDNFVYNFISKKRYVVDDKFPRIVGITLPKGVVGLTYDIELSSIELLEG